MSASRLGQVSCGEGEGLGVGVATRVGVALSMTASGGVGATGWGAKGMYGMQMQAAVRTNKATTRIKIENLLFDSMITCIHSLANGRFSTRIARIPFRYDVGE
jgi:hypothetical protein